MSEDIICSQCDTVRGNRRKCKNCNRLYQAKWYANNKKRQYERTRTRLRSLRRKLFDYLKQHPCCRCGFNNPLALEFHHLRDKKEDVGKMVANGNSWKNILIEIEKCEVLCANCHKLQTALEFGWYSDVLDG